MLNRKNSRIINNNNVIVGDALDYNNNMTFSTPDQDNDIYSSDNCATRFKSAWWFKACSFANPNGPYTDSENNGHQYIAWYSWKNVWISLKSMQLMIRPRA